jgi:hypothetical protein
MRPVAQSFPPDPSVPLVPNLGLVNSINPETAQPTTGCCCDCGCGTADIGWDPGGGGGPLLPDCGRTSIPDPGPITIVPADPPCPGNSCGGDRPYGGNGTGDILDRAAAATRRPGRFGPAVDISLEARNPLRPYARVNPGAGNLVVQLGPPAAGPADPRLLFTYNSSSLSANEYGTGWMGT